MQNNWHETLSQAIDVAVLELKQNAAFTPEAEQDLRDKFSDGLKYGETKQAHAPLEFYKNKPTRKYAHVTIYRNDVTGRYEQVNYVL